MDLEPIDVVFDSDEVAVNDAVFGTRDNPSFYINPPITDCVGIALLYVNVPFTYYVIDNTNNRFDFKETPIAAFRQCLIAPGTYNSQNIGAQILAAMDNAGVPNATTNYTVEVDNTDLKLLISHTGGTSTQFSIDFNVNNSAYRTLGFNIATYTSTNGNYFDNNETEVVGKYHVISPRVVNLTGPGQMFLSSSFAPTLFGKVRNQAAIKPLLGFWSVNANYTGTIETFRESPMRIPFSKMTVGQVDLKLLLGNRTTYNSAAGETDYLQLEGESYQVALRFFRQIPSENTVLDAAGNSTTQMKTGGRGMVYGGSSTRPGDVLPRAKSRLRSI